MILCVTPNAAIDRTLVVPGFALGKVLRPVETIVAAGGKGINVARAVRLLGGEATCAGFLGGYSGRQIAVLAERDALTGMWTWVEGESRTCVIIVDPDLGQSTVVNEVGLTIRAEDWRNLHEDVLRAAAYAECVCLSGSLPPGVDPDMFAHLIRELHEAGRTVWIDTSATGLEAALSVQGAAIKVNAEEAGALLNLTISDMKAAGDAAQALRARGARVVVITLGADGAVFDSEEGRWWAKPPAIKVVNAIASGDCLLAGLMIALMAGCSRPEALKRGVAAGAANALTTAGSRFNIDDFERLLAETHLETIKE